MTSMIILTGEVSHCFCLSWSFGNYTYPTQLGDSPIITTKNNVISFNMEKMGYLSPSVPNLVFERETHMA